MKITSYTKLDTYEVSSSTLNIYWGEEAFPPKEDETEPYWTYEFCRASIHDSRDVLIEKIIATRYPTYGSEVAAIANGGADSEEHQAFRQLAKQLANNFINSK